MMEPDWKPRPSDVAGKDPANQIQTGYYPDGQEEQLMVLIPVNQWLKTGMVAAHIIIPGNILILTPHLQTTSQMHRLFHGHLSVIQKWY